MEQSTTTNRSNTLKLTQLLRALGATALTLSGAIFLIQGYNAWNGIERFFALFALVLGTGALGVFCAKKLKETKGARTFLALATAGFSALCAQIGGMVYNLFTVGHNSVPSFLQFSSVKASEIGLALGLTTLCIVPLVSLSFKAFNRKNSTMLFSVFVALNAALVLPVRTDQMLLITVFASMALIWALMRSGYFFKRFPATFEEQISMIMMTTPVFIALIRGAFYADGALYPAALFTFSSFSSLILWYVRKKSGESTSVWAGLGLLFTSMTWFTLAVPFGEFIHHNIVRIGFLFWPVLFIVPTYIIARGFKVSGILETNWFTGATAIFSTVVTLLSLTLVTGSAAWSAGLIMFVLGTIYIVDGYLIKNKSAFASGILLSLVGAVKLLGLAAIMVNAFHWLFLAILGGGIILLASQIERRSDEFRALWARFNKHFDEDELGATASAQITVATSVSTNPVLNPEDYI